MAKKQFKTESKKLLDMMINSIYTHKEIFLRELISNASDAIDKLYFRSLTDSSIPLTRGDYAIWIDANRDQRTITITDNGCGMTEEELESNLGTIAKSGSFEFKRDNKEEGDVDIIGQFGVGFYSAFMVADKITVTTKPFGAEEAFRWESSGVDGYTITKCEKATFGTEIVLNIKEDSEEEKYSEFLDEYRIRGLIRKYSDYIRYPINMEVEKEKLKEGSEDEYETVIESETLNSMTPIWRKAKGDVSDEDYNRFYTEKFFDYQPPVKVITQKSEGTATYTALLFVPSHAPFNYYTKDYEKGLELYSSGVMIMDKCSDLLPDYFGFVKGIVDSQDLSLNISREMLQHDRQLKVMAKAIEKKIKNELEKLMESDREAYEKFFDAFGVQLKYGVYSDFGSNKDTLKDLLLFYSSNGKMVSLKEYTSSVPEDKKIIYYAVSETREKAALLPKCEAVRDKGLEVLYLTDDIDEFALKMLGKYGEFEFKNVSDEALDLATEDEKAKIEEANSGAEEMLNLMKEAIGSVSAVKFSANLTKHPACLSSEGELSVEMEKVLRKMPGSEGAPKANVILELNIEHPLTAKLKALYETDKEALKKYAELLYGIACLVSGLTLENPSSFSKVLSEVLAN